MQASETSNHRRYGFACIQCRRKKIKCDGNRPNCRRCTKTRSHCTYKDADGSIAYLRSELGKQQTRVRDLEEGIKTLALASGEERDVLIQQLAETVGRDVEEAPADRSSDVEEIPIDANDVVETREQHDGQDITVDEHGILHFYGATSRFHSGQEVHSKQSTNSASDRAFHTRWLASNARFQKSWERMAYDGLEKDAQVGTVTASTLLQIYWTWQAPLHNCVYRQCFFRDMAMGGPYFNQFLLNVIYAHASRHVPEDDPIYYQIAQGEAFLQRAKGLLIDELGAERPSIPTIQGLLILGGRQCAVGKSSEGWLYTGMAIRMIKDLGLHLHNSSLGLKNDLEPDDLEARKRLYLSAYSWDKSISLCLGRPPSLTELPYSPNSLLDEAGDLDPWTPFYLGEESISYPPTACKTTATFRYFCELSRIVSDCYNTVYSGRLEGIKIQSVLALERTLQDYRGKLPETLRIDNASALKFCPPPHIFCLNILLHTLMILIYRPFFSKRANRALFARARQVCLDKAKTVNSFFRLYGRTFNFRNQSYLISYCVYTAATVELQELQNNSGQSAKAAAERLSTTMKMLETEAKQTPGIRRSIDIIRTRLQKWQSATSPEETIIQENPSALSQEESVQNLRAQNEDHASGSDEQRQESSATSHYTEGTISLVDGFAFNGNFGMAPEFGLQDGGFPTIMDDPISMDWYAYDASGGFVPDMTNWTWYDTTVPPDSC